MSNQAGQIAGVAQTFATATTRAAAAGNLQRLEIARGNVRAARDQIDLEATAQKRAISTSLQQFQGAQAAARAHRGAITSDAGVINAANAQAADQTALVESNAAAKRVAVLAANQVQFEDTTLAALQGGLQGLDIGTQIAQALISEAEVVQRQSSTQLQNSGPVNAGAPPTFENTITSILQIPGLDLGDFLTETGLNFD